MKKIVCLAAILITSLAAMGQQPVLTMLSPDTHDFGKINEADGRVTTVFEFKNEGMTPLILNNVKASCGCTSPKWTREPIEPGQTGQITVTYNPSGRPGRFQKTVTITSNATEPTKRVFIKGEVIPKPAAPVDNYPVKMGTLGLKAKSLNFQNVKMGEFKQLTIEYANQGKENISLGVMAHPGTEFFDVQPSLADIKPGESGQLQITLATTSSPLYGPVEATVYLVVNNQIALDNQHAIVLKANIEEDFSQLTSEQIMKAPILEVNKDNQLGTVKVGKKLSYKLALNNAGIHLLHVRRVIVDAPGLKVTAPKNAIKGGKKGEIRFDIVATNVEPAAYSRTMTLITNDPNNPVVHVQLNWKVEE